MQRIRMIGGLATLGMALTAEGSFHLMQIEQAIGGVNGDVSKQAVQLRMRSNFQNQMQGARLWVHDATGSNPVLVIDFANSVPNHGLGVRILLTSAGFTTDPAVTPDFVMETLIPGSYLAAGSMTFENNLGNQIYWRLSWGGDDYTGPTNGSSTNDDDGDFGPAWPDPLPTTGLGALLFQGPASAKSTTNADDYAVSDPSTWTNNADQSGVVEGIVSCDGDIDDSGDVGFNDLVTLLAEWGAYEPCPPHKPADLNQDCTVGFSDLVTLLSGWGPCR